jgi:hypothetical protein
MFLPAALVKHVLMPLLDVKSTEALERTSKSVYASMQKRDSLRAYDCLKVMHRDVSRAVQLQSIDVQAALQYVRRVPFPRNQDLYRQGWALDFMRRLWAFYAAQQGRGFAPFGIEFVERIYEWLGLVVPGPLRAAFDRLVRERAH